MSILTASQQAIMRLVGRKPASVVSSTEEICVEMTALALEAGEDIAKRYDWQKLVKFYTVTMNGTDESYPFPDDYDRMVQASEVYDPNNWCWGFQHVPIYSDWLQYQISGFGMIYPGIWTIRDDQFHFMPRPAAGKQAIFPYVSSSIFADSGGNAKNDITADSDVFLLDERLLTLSLIWRWLSMKRMDYQQEFDDFEVALSQEMARDKGGRVIRRPDRVRTFSTHLAWPWELGA